MNISVELTYSPLRDSYEDEIIRFIKALRASDLTVMENPLSTQVFGPYDRVMEVLGQEIKNSLSTVEQGVFFIKMVKTDRSDYQPHF